MFRWLCWLFVVLGTLSSASGDKVPFNYEISAHVSDTVRSLLSVGVRAATVVLDCFAAGLDSHNITTTSALYRALLNANSELSAVYAGFEDGTFVWHGLFNSTLPPVFSRRLAGANFTRDYFMIDDIGIPTTPLFSYTFDPRLRPWYLTLKSAALVDLKDTNAKDNITRTRFWGHPYMFSTGRPGVTFSSAVYTKKRNPDSGSEELVFDGVVAIDFALEELTNFLRMQHQATSRSVYLLDRSEEGLLLAASSSAASNSLMYANSSTDELLVSAVKQLSPLLFPETLVIVEESYVQCASLKENSTNVDWVVLVTMPANPAKDFIGWYDPEAKPIIAIAATSLTISLLGMFLTYRYRTALIMKMSQLGFLSMFLVGCLLLDLSILAGLGTNTLKECRLRVWAPNLSFVFAFTPILAKTWNLSRILERRAARCKRPVFFGLVVLTLATEFSILGWATTGGAMDPVSVTYLGSEGAYETHRVCGQEGPRTTFSWINLAFNSLLVLAGSVLAFRSRNYHESLTESSALAVNVYSILVFGLIYLVVSSSVDLDVASYLLLEAMALGWGTSMSIFLLLGPRLFKLWKLGDIKAVAWLTRHQPQYSHTVPDPYETDGNTLEDVPDMSDPNFLPSASPFHRGLDPIDLKLERSPTFRRDITTDFQVGTLPPSSLSKVTSFGSPRDLGNSYAQESFSRDPSEDM